MNPTNHFKNLRYYLGLLFLFCFKVAFCSISICSWNLKDFGISKSDAGIDFMASIVNNYDVIAIQEVTTSPGGAQAVARLADCLNRKGKSWDYSISNPTSSETGHSSERYAFIWNKSTVSKTGKAWLENHYATEIAREPYFATFVKDGKEFTIGNFHAKPKTKHPETDIMYFKFLPALYPVLNLIFCGDFNCPQSNKAFNTLKKTGYRNALTGQKTTLKTKCVQNDCLASEYDNFFFDPQKLKPIKSGVEHFYKKFESAEKARQISDHLPIFFIFD